MILEYLEHALSPCPRRWRELGYLREQIAIDARQARHRAAWAPHQEASRRAILEAAQRCGRRECALLLGAGLQHDLPLEELGRMFGTVVLADLIHRPLVRHRALRRLGGRGRTVEFDASGVLERFCAEAPGLGPEALVDLVRGADAGLPAGLDAEPDLVVSAGLASQLMLLPLEWLESRRETGETLGGRLRSAALAAHLDWLRRRSGIRLLITDQANRRVPVDGGEAEESPIDGAELLGAPDRSWLWRLAPAPEISRYAHVEHRVGSWILRQAV